MTVYGKIGGSLQQIGGGHPGAGWGEMNEQRPQADMVAQADGTWIAPTPTAAERRDERDTKFEAVRWRIERHQSEVRQGREPTEPIEPLDTYWQALRDVPEQEGFPEVVVWPEVPALPE